MRQHTIRIKQPFPLELGGELPQLTIGYHTWGERAPDDSNVVWITHALTANSNPADWWSGLVGEGKLIDPERHYIVCANVLGSCYGTTGPLEVNPDSWSAWFGDFPAITIRDIVRVHDLLRQHLGIESIGLGLGGSMGGCQLLEWAAWQPNLFDNLALIATNARESPWGIAIHKAQRMAIEAAADWGAPTFAAGQSGLKAARAMGMISYRNQACYEHTQSDAEDLLTGFRAESYQQHQGDKLAARFNSYSYHLLLRALDGHNVGRGRGGVAKALARVKAKALVIGIKSDLLYPVSEQAELAGHLPNARLQVIDSLYGHDGFLVETEQISELLAEHFSTLQIPVKCTL